MEKYWTYLNVRFHVEVGPGRRKIADKLSKAFLYTNNYWAFMTQRHKIRYSLWNGLSLMFLWFNAI